MAAVGAACSTAIQQMSRYIAGLKYTDTMDKALQIRRAFLLSNPASLVRSVAGKTTLEGLQRASDPVAAGLDSLLSLLTQERTKGTQSLPEFVQSLKSAAATGKAVARTGVNPNTVAPAPAIGTPVLTGNAFLDTWSELTHRGFDAETQAFRQLAVERSLADQARAVAKNEGLSGPAYQARVQELQQQPTDAMALQAAHDADYITLQNPNLFSEGVRAVGAMKEQAQAQLAKLQQQRAKLVAQGQNTDKIDLQIQAARGKVGRAAVGKAAVDYVAPFPKVPSNAGLRYLDYSPAGLFLTLARQITNPSQRALVEGLSRNITGGALAMLGWALYENHAATGLSPDEAGTQDRSMDASQVPNGVKVGGQWVNITKLSPAGGVIGIGARLHRLADQAAGRPTHGLAAALGQAGAEAPAVVGGGLAESPIGEVNDLTGALSGLKATELGRMAGGAAASVVPNVVQAATRGADIERQTTGQGFGDTALNQVKAGVPGLRGSLPPRLDYAGQPIQTGPGGFLGAIDRMVDPVQFRRAKEDRVAAELDNHQLNFSKLSANAPTLTGEKGRLSADAMTTFRRGEGADLHNALAATIGSPGYLSASHDDQTRMLQSTERAVAAAWKTRKQALASPLHLR